MTFQDDNDQTSKKAEIVPLTAAQPLFKRSSVSVRIASVQDLVTLGTIANKSGLYKLKNSEQCFMAILRGADMGLSPAESLSGIELVNGKLTLSGGLMAAMIDNSPYYRYQTVVSTDKRCSLRFSRYYPDTGWIESGESDFTIEEAKRANLLGKDVWRNYPKSMLFWRSLSQGARMYCAGLFMGAVYTPEELGAEVDENGQPINLNTNANFVESDQPANFSDGKTQKPAAKPTAQPSKKPLKVVPKEPVKNPHYVGFVRSLRETLEVDREIPRAWLLERNYTDPSLLPADMMDDLIYVVVNEWHRRELGESLSEDTLWTYVNKVSSMTPEELESANTFSAILEDIKILASVLTPSGELPAEQSLETIDVESVDADNTDTDLDAATDALDSEETDF